MPRTRPCPPEVRRGRLAKAEQFVQVAAQTLELADEDAEIADVYVTLCVHAGIAAADVICCARLGEHAQGETHTEAVGLLRSVDPGAARQLGVLLGMKTKAGYSYLPVTGEDCKRAGRAADTLLESARRTHAATGV